MVRHLALHPLGLVEGHGREDGLPGAAKNTGDDARLASALHPQIPAYISRPYHSRGPWL